MKSEKVIILNWYVNKCQVLKTVYLCKVSFMLNIKCNIHIMNSLNKYFQFQFYKQIVMVTLHNISLNLIHWWKWLLIMQQTCL